MELSPQSVRTTGFKTVRKGYDPDEVDAFKEQVAGAIETAQNQAAAMEARARAAVAKLQEVSQHAAAASAAEPSTVSASDADAETISRTLLLAQRTADSTIAEARAEAESISGAARSEAANILDSARSMAGKLIDEARIEARRSGEDERARAENEVQALLARREFLISDVDHLEQHLVTQRDRVRDAASALQDIVDRVPGGLGDLRRPLLSASGEPVAPAPPFTSSISLTEGEADESGAPGQLPDAQLPISVPPVPADDGDDGDDEVLGVSLGVAPSAAPTAPTGPPSLSESLWRELDVQPLIEPTPVHGEPLLDFNAEVTAEVPVVSPRPEARSSGPSIGGDELN